MDRELVSLIIYYSSRPDEAEGSMSICPDARFEEVAEPRELLRRDRWKSIKV